MFGVVLWSKYLQLFSTFSIDIKRSISRSRKIYGKSMDLFQGSEFSSVMQYWSRSQTWDTWRLKLGWERRRGHRVMWWPDNDNTMSSLMCHPHPLWRLTFRMKELSKKYCYHGVFWVSFTSLKMKSKEKRNKIRELAVKYHKRGQY